MSQDKEHPYRFSDDRGSDNRVKVGPLAIALLDRHQLELFCTQPLVLDFMFRKFTCGFPSLDAAGAKMQEAQEVQRALQPSLLSVQEGADHRPSREAPAGGVFALLAGTHPTFGSLTFLPGAQFIITQLVTRPGFCYSVPAVRMGMYLMVYLAMIALFGTKVLMYSGALGAGEVVFFIYVMVRRGGWGGGQYSQSYLRVMTQLAGRVTEFFENTTGRGGSERVGADRGGSGRVGSAYFQTLTARVRSNRPDPT